MKHLVAFPLSLAILVGIRAACPGADISGSILYAGDQMGRVHVAVTQTLSGNKVLQLDGAGASVEIPTLTSLAGSEITIQFWFRGNSYQSSVRQQSSGWVVAGWNGLHILQNDGSLDGVAAGDGITDGNWHHVLFTWKQGTVDGFASYLDGRLVAKRDSADVPIPNYDASVWLGSFRGTGEFTAGEMDSVAVWQRALLPEEVASNWNKALAGTEPGLLACWDFDDNTYNDKSANHYDGLPAGNAVLVDADIPGFNAGLGSAIIQGPGAYTISGLPSGPNYSATAFMDANGNGKRDAGEPSGTHPGNPFDLAGDKAGLDIILTEPPLVTLQPVGARGATGSTVTFEVAARGTPPLAFRWFRDDAALFDDSRIDGADTRSLRIRGLAAEDTGSYSCVVSNLHGVATSLAARLDVIVNGKSIGGVFQYEGVQSGKIRTTVAQLRANKVLDVGITATNYASTTLTDLSGDELSIEYWFKGSSISSAVRQQGGPGYIVAGWGANYHIMSNDGGVAQPVKISEPLTNVVDGNWHHVAMTWKRNTVNGFTSYFDGEIVAQRNSGSTPVPFIGSQVFFGAWDGNAEFGRGQLDEIAIWSRALTRAEIRSQARNGLTGSEAGLRGYWNFDDGMGQDLTVNGNHAELRNGAAIVDATNPGLGASYSDVFAGPGPFQIPAIPAGNGYSLLAFMDADGNGAQSPKEPRGGFDGNPFNLSTDLNNLQLVLYDPPVVLTNPLTVSVVEGATIHLSVAAAGTSNTFQWRRYLVPLANDGRISGAQSNALTITGATLADAGAYSVAISNRVGATVSAPVGVVTQPAILASGLIGHWKFDETTGEMAAEATGLSQAGLLSNFQLEDSQWMPGIIGGAISLNHSNQNYVMVPDYQKPASTMAVSVWVWAESRPIWASILKNWGDPQVGQFHFGLNAGSGELSNYLTDGSGATVSASDTTPFPLKSWQHVVFVADGARMRIYRNGSLVAASAPYNGTLLAPPMYVLGIGAKMDDFGFGPASNNAGFWDGRLDDLGIWTRALSPDEVMGLYRSGLSGNGIDQAFAVRQVALTISLDAGDVTVRYDGGTLQWTDDLMEAWSDVPGASATSFTTKAVGGKFFRVR